MRFWLFFIAMCFTYFGCESEKRPILPSGYLQSIFSEIKKIDTTARVLNFISGDGRFEFIDDLLGSRTFEVSPIKLNGEVRRVIEHDYEVIEDLLADTSKENATTQYFLSGGQIIEKRFRNSEENVIYKVEYEKKMIRRITAFYNHDKDSARIRFLYNDDLIKKKQVFSSSGELNLTFDFYYNNGQNPDYKYTIVRTKHDVFDKFEFNNKLRQAILSHFDTTGKLKWLQYTEYDSKGNRIYDETFNKTYINPVFRKIEYAYNEYNDMTELKTVFPKSNTKKLYEFRYTRRDSVNNWIERKTFEDDKIFMVTKRLILYKHIKKTGEP